jgi:HlyD family secretion protein
MNTTTAVPRTEETWWRRHRRRVWRGVRIVLVLSALAVVAWWLLLTPVVVTTHTVATGTVRAEVMGTGTLEARISAIVGPKVGGLIVRMHADQGDRVPAGALLFELEASDMQQQVAIAEAEVAAATATMERLAASRRAAAAVQSQQRTSHQRVVDLIATDVASEQDLDKARESLSIAEAELSIAAAAIIEGQKRLDAAERALAYQRARLEDATIEAPFDGLVVRRDREAGDVASAGASVLQLVSTDEMWITAWVDETELARLAPDQPARVVFRSEPDVAYEGVVARIGREADRETREIVADVRVKRLPARWAIGQRAEVYIEVARADGATVIPAPAVLVREGATGVMVEQHGRARWREITVGLRGRDIVQVTAGLSPGDVLVRAADAGAAPLRDGRRVRAR